MSKQRVYCTSCHSKIYLEDSFEISIFSFGKKKFCSSCFYKFLKQSIFCLHPNGAKDIDADLFMNVFHGKRPILD